MANNYSVSGFWRSWHRSYNLWIVRYIYVPLGGTKNAIWATALVFTFVAMWHDLSLRLLAWGWSFALFVLPEMLFRNLLSFKRYGKEPWYRHVAAIGGVANIVVLILANLLGFALGIDGVKYLVSQLTGSFRGSIRSL